MDNKERITANSSQQNLVEDSQENATSDAIIDINNNNTVSKLLKLLPRSSKQPKPTKPKTYKRSIIYAMLGLSCFAFYDPIVDSLASSVMSLKEGGFFASNWQNLPVPLDLCFYVFELVNAKQFLRGEKPFVQEKGPYCYHEYKSKHKLVWRDKTVEYIERFRFEFVPENSRPANDTLQILNYPILIVVQMTRAILDSLYMSFASPIVYNLVVTLLRASGEKLIEQRTASELLDGREINLVKYLEVVLTPLRSLGLPLPKFGVGFYELNEEKFGFVHIRKNTDFGPFEVYTSTSSNHKITQITKFEGSSVLPNMDAPCNAVQGGEGILMGQYFTGNRLWVFNQHACRSVSLIKNSTVFEAGTMLERFIIDPDTFNAFKSENECFCFRGRSKKQCDGVSDMAPCFGGIPLQLSFPHFLFSSIRQSQIDGLQPNPDKHLGFLNVNRRFGAPLMAEVMMQVNTLIEPISYVPALRNVPHVVLPIAWFRQGVTLPKALIYAGGMGFNIANYGAYLGLGAGLVAAAISGNSVRRSRSLVPTLGPTATLVE